MRGQGLGLRVWAGKISAVALGRGQGLGLRVWAGRRSLAVLAKGLELLQVAGRVGMEEECVAALVREPGLGLGQARVGLGVDLGVEWGILEEGVRELGLGLAGVDLGLDLGAVRGSLVVLVRGGELELAGVEVG